MDEDDETVVCPTSERGTIFPGGSLSISNAFIDTDTVSMADSAAFVASSVASTG